mmetsp:Transcript_3516/g.4327  ORF Transcript_3516/g.4327 Transcript_3516/m.4327 type:complete len:131 (+) Transcript_3516:164-556(+)
MRRRTQIQILLLAFLQLSGNVINSLSIFDVVTKQTEHKDRDSDTKLHLRRAESSEVVETDGLFDLMDCESYDYLWVFDLHHSCLYGENGCECEDAEQRVANDEITCEKGVTACPEECPICIRCMQELGCI